jgi:hypothetical protein
MDRLAEIKRLYYNTTAATVQKDLARAVRLLKEMDEGDRDRAAVFMDGLSQMRSEWGLRKRPPQDRGARKRR